MKNICDTCTEVCKATHPRESCTLYKPSTLEERIAEDLLAKWNITEELGFRHKLAHAILSYLRSHLEEFVEIDHENLRCILANTISEWYGGEIDAGSDLGQLIIILKSSKNLLRMKEGK